MLAFVASLLLFPVQVGEVFTDTEYRFSFEPPVRVRQLPDEERARLLGVPLEKERNIPRDAWAVAGEPFRHNHLWLDESTYGRSIKLLLLDSLPWRSPEEFMSMVDPGAAAGTRPRDLPEPIGPGLIHETTFESNGRLVRKQTVYLLDLGDQRSALISMQAFDDDWVVVKPQFEQSLQTIKWQRGELPEDYKAMRQAAGAPLGPGLGGGPGARRAGAGRADLASMDPEAWMETEVLGSFVLAAVALLALLLGGKAGA